ncbi:hypothetical protein ACRAJ3_11500 [Rhodococcus pyridinivorans]|uniref:hypothetical protein n=1 Tax=Rhodococcus pyridinivorans TaxID=103816 RepID=UPI003D7FC152
MSDPTTPEQRPPLPDPNGGCACTWHTQDAGCGYTEVIPEYEPACPEHSHHLYDPRAGMWIDDPRGALDRVRELSEEGKCWGGADAIEEFIRRLDEILDGTS